MCLDFHWSNNNRYPPHFQHKSKKRSPEDDRGFFHMLGQQLSTVFSGSRQAGAHSVRWDGKNAKTPAVPAGIYVLRTFCRGAEVHQKDHPAQVIFFGQVKPPRSIEDCGAVFIAGLDAWQPVLGNLFTIYRAL